MSLSASSHSSSQLRRIRSVPPGSGLQRGALPVARHRSKVRREIFSSVQRV